jgi:hypothetical protein
LESRNKLPRRVKNDVSLYRSKHKKSTKKCKKTTALSQKVLV